MTFCVLDTNQTADITSVFLDSKKSEHDLLPQILHNEHVKLRVGDKNLKWEKEGLPFDSDYELQKLKIGEQLRDGRRLLSLAEGRESSKDYRLVKKCKSPTRISSDEETHLESKRMQSKTAFFERAKAIDAKHQEWLKLPFKDQTYTVKNHIQRINPSIGLARSENGLEIINENTGEILKPKVGRRAAIARIYEREWSGESRIRVMAQGSASEPPPQQSGDRETSELSQKGASKILDSGAYVSAVRGGFTTFLTLTFNSEARQRINSQESTIGKEVSRFFDAISKTYQRGWQFINDNNETISVPAANDALDYVWVAEMPENKKGEPNPHCHVLLRWGVEQEIFKPWAQRIESLWGLGFAKLERIKNANAASGYLLKALGYMVKGESQDQGQFKGNRYNISKAARAPAWECLAEFEAQNMCAIINEVREKWQRKDKPIRAVINKTKWQLNTYKKAYNIQKSKKGRTQAERNQTLGKMQKRIAEFEQTIKDSYEKLTNRGARANEYQVTFNNPELLAKFIGWANATRYWGAEMLSGFTRDCEKERMACGELVKQARDYWKSFGDNGEYAEQIWAQRLRVANNNNFEEPQTCDVYEEYLGMMA